MLSEERWFQHVCEDVAKGEEVGGKLAIANDGRTIRVVEPGNDPDGEIVGTTEDFGVYVSGHDLT